jgi:hypothetical protein
MCFFVKFSLKVWLPLRRGRLLFPLAALQFILG